MGKHGIARSSIFHQPDWLRIGEVVGVLVILLTASHVSW